jgi:hypothetical protein
MRIGFLEIACRLEIPNFQSAVIVSGHDILFVESAGRRGKKTVKCKVLHNKSSNKPEAADYLIIFNGSLAFSSFHIPKSEIAYIIKTCIINQIIKVSLPYHLIMGPRDNKISQQLEACDHLSATFQCAN